MDSKKPWESKTIWGAVLMLLAMIFSYFKIDIGEPTAWVEAITGLIGFVTVIVGRVKAVKRIE